MVLQQTKDLLEMARQAMAVEAMIVSHIDGTETMEQIIKIDNRVYALITRALELLNTVEEVERLTTDH